MDWPYHLVDTTPEERHTRRILLDRYGVYAQLSAFVPVLLYQLYRLGLWVHASRRRQQDAQYDAVPSSPRLKHSRLEKAGSWGQRWRGLVWWLGEEFGAGWGERGHWVAAGVWSAWLGFLCVHRTGDDYLHVTKRFGVIAASQLPLHYMLSMKSLYSPLAVAFRTSHEHLNTYHRISGRIIYTLLVLHGAFYINFFVLANLLAVRLTSLVVWIGIIALASMTVLLSTSLQRVRSWSYRVFFVLHLSIGVSILPLLFFHASPLRIYVTEALFLFIFDIICRKVDTIVSFATITSIPNTSLVKIDIPVSSYKINRFKAAPGQHVYLQIPQQSVPTSSPSSKYLYELLYNPFTVAAVSNTHISLVIRSLSGPSTTALKMLARMNKAKPPLNIEGPLGASRHWPNLAAEYDRVLLVAGGVGATFAVPVYKNLKAQLAKEVRSSERVKMVWCVRDIVETSWAFGSAASSSTTPPALSSSPPSAQSTQQDDHDDTLSLYVTDARSHYHPSPRTVDGSGDADGDLELDDLPQSSSTGTNRTGTDTLPHTNGRPDLRRVVDDIFRHGAEEKVAVLVCGPKGMARELRAHVGRWVGQGREVWFWEEGFGW